MKYSTYTLLLSISLGIILENTEASIKKSDLYKSTEIMKSHASDKMPITLCDAAIAIESGLISKMRNNSNILYKKSPSGDKLIDAEDKGNDDVTKLLVLLFPSNGGILNIFTNGGINFSNLMKDMPKSTSAEIAAKLLMYCKNLRTQTGGVQKLFSSEILKNFENSLPLNKKNRVDTIMNTISKAVQKSITFEKTKFFYPSYTTELLLISFCYLFFNDISDIEELMKAFKEEGLINDSDNVLKIYTKTEETSYEQSYIQHLQEIESNIKEGKTLSAEDILLHLSSEKLIVPFEKGETFESNIETLTTEGETIADCVETTIRQLATMFCTYDAREDTITPHNNFNDRVKEFFKRFNKKNEVNSKNSSIHNAWASICHDMGKKYRTAKGDLDASPIAIADLLIQMTGTPVSIEGKNLDDPKILTEILQEIANSCGRTDVSFVFKAPEEKMENMYGKLIKTECIILDKTDEKNQFCFEIQINPGAHAALQSMSKSIEKPLKFQAISEMDMLMDISKFSKVNASNIRNFAQKFKTPYYLCCLIDKGWTSFNLEKTLLEFSKLTDTSSNEFKQQKAILEHLLSGYGEQLQNCLSEGFVSDIYRESPKDYISIIDGYHRLKEMSPALHEKLKPVMHEYLNETAVFLADSNKYEEVKNILDKIINTGIALDKTNVKSTDKKTSLLNYLIKKKEEELALLVVEKLSIDSLKKLHDNINDTTPLSNAVLFHLEKIALNLIDKLPPEYLNAAKPDKNYINNPLLMVICSQKTEKLAKHLIEKLPFEELTKKSEYFEETPLGLARKRGKATIVEYLNARGVTE